MTVADWREFYLMAGGSIAALTGLLFVAMSIHLADILARPVLTRDVSIAMYGMLYQLLFCGFMLVPGVSVPTVGWVVTLAGLAWSTAYMRFSRGSRRADRVVNSGMGFITVAVGALLVFGFEWALFLYAAVLGIGVAALVRLCWRLLTMAMRDLRTDSIAVHTRPARSGRGSAAGA